jgi:hypothetical protein
VPRGTGGKGQRAGTALAQRPSCGEDNVGRVAAAPLSPPLLHRTVHTWCTPCFLYQRVVVVARLFAWAGWAERSLAGAVCVPPPHRVHSVSSALAPDDSAPAFARSTAAHAIRETLRDPGIEAISDLATKEQKVGGGVSLVRPPPPSATPLLAHTIHQPTHPPTPRSLSAPMILPCASCACAGTWLCACGCVQMREALSSHQLSLAEDKLRDPSTRVELVAVTLALLCGCALTVA